MRIREPREHWLLSLLVWGGLFGGIPTAMLIASASGSMQATGPLGLLLLFPVIAVTVVGISLRRYLRSGFTFVEDGIEGAHDAERELLPWADIGHLEWRWAGPTSSVTINDRPLPSGPALYAVLTDGRPVRLSQSCAADDRRQQRMAQQLDAAVAADVLPVPWDPTIPTDGCVDGGEGVGAWHDAPVRRWSSSGVGDALPSVDSPLDDAPPPPPAGVDPAAFPPPPPSAWPRADAPHGQDATDDQDAPPTWPSG